MTTTKHNKKRYALKKHDDILVEPVDHSNVYYVAMHTKSGVEIDRFGNITLVCRNGMRYIVEDAKPTVFFYSERGTWHLISAQELERYYYCD